MDLKEIVLKYLEENKFDGLYRSESCACRIDDIMPCDEPLADCEPGRIKNCEGCDDQEENKSGCYNNFDYCIEG